MSPPGGLLDAGAEPVDLAERRCHERGCGIEPRSVGFVLAER